MLAGLLPKRILRFINSGTKISLPAMGGIRGGCCIFKYLFPLPRPFPLREGNGTVYAILRYPSEILDFGNSPLPRTPRYAAIRLRHTAAKPQMRKEIHTGNLGKAGTDSIEPDAAHIAPRTRLGR